MYILYAFFVHILIILGVFYMKKALISAICALSVLGAAEANALTIGSTCSLAYKINYVFATQGGSDDCYGNYNIYSTTTGKTLKIFGILFGVEGTPTNEKCAAKLNSIAQKQVNQMCAHQDANFVTP